MNNEIKEILNRLEKIGFYASVPKELAYMTTNITPQECKTILDYITNLQQENERLKRKTKEQSLLLIDYQDMEQKLENYKSRIEKAVEYINSKKRTITKYEAENTRLPIDTFMYGVDNLLNILNGRNDE